MILKIYIKEKFQKVVHLFYPSKRARKTPEKIQVSKDDLAELSQTAQPDIETTDTTENESSEENVSLEEVSESENHESETNSDDSEASNS